MADNCRGPVVIGKVMNEVGGLGPRGLPVSPDSDCNSNHHGSASYLSNTSSQDIDFIQDNSDYQWFLDYGYRDGGTNHHTSILSLPDSYVTNDINYYDTLAKNMDANLAEADMESFRTEDIHALLTNLPPICADNLSQEMRQGECYASVSGSMMGKFEFDSSSPQSSSHGENSANSASLSLYKSELLFSPVKEMPMPGANFSVDSLDCDMMLTCQANKDNYTIAFEGSVTMYSEDSDYHETDKSENSGTGSAHWSSDLTKKQTNSAKLVDASMTQSDSGSLTTWSNLKKRCSDNHLQRHPSGNNNSSRDDSSQLGLNDSSTKSQSMPNLYKQKLRNLLVNSYFKSHNGNLSDTNAKRKPVKVFDIQHQTQGASVSDMATSADVSTSDNTGNKQQVNFNLVRLFMKQKSMSSEGMSTTMDQLSSTENWPTSQSGESNSSGSKLYVHARNLDGSDQKLNESGAKTYGLIAEEPEEPEVSRGDCIDHISENSGKSPCPAFHKDKTTGSSGSGSNNNNSFGSDRSSHKQDREKERCRSRLTLNDLMSRSVQTSQFSEIASLKNAHKCAPTFDKPPAVQIGEASFLNKLKEEGKVQKPVYVLYPNYVLPNLDFLEKQPDHSKVLLLPHDAPNPRVASVHKARPFSFNDLEHLKKKGFGHVRDWDSLNLLLPQEYRKILSEVPELSEHIKPTNQEPPSFAQNVRRRRRPMSCDYSSLLNQAVNSSSSSTATQPSSGYRGSSTILSDSQNSPAPTNNLNPLFVYRYDSVTSSEASLQTSERQRSIVTTPSLPLKCVSSSKQPEHVPPRPPLPRSILRRGLDKMETNKRFSLYETSEEDLLAANTNTIGTKPRPETFTAGECYFRRAKLHSETEDEGVDAGTSSSSFDEHHEAPHPATPNKLRSDFLLSNISTDELAQLEEFLKISGISTSDHEEMNEESLLQLRSYVSRFLALKINSDGSDHAGGRKAVSFLDKNSAVSRQCLDTKQFIAPNNSPNVSGFNQHKNYNTKTLVDMPICEETEGAPHASSPAESNISCSLTEKRCLVSAVADAVELLIKTFSSATNQAELIALGDSTINPACAKLALTTLCPALYAVLSDGLKPSLETSFGAINNSVWQVVEASAQQGPLTKALNELVMRINSEDVITEGLVKFNAFVFGLLNVRSLDAWMSYLRTRESVLKKHYAKNSLLGMQHTGGPNVRALLDNLIAALQPLALLPFQFDILFEYRQLQLSFKRLDSYQQLSPTHKLCSSPNFNQWNSAKLNLSAGSNRSTTDSDDISSTTVRHLPLQSPPHSDPAVFKSRSRRENRERPRSCVESGTLCRPNFKLGDVTMVAKKRWSGISSNSKMYLVYDRLVREDDEEYTDSLEHAQQNRLEGDDAGCTIGSDPPSLPVDGPESLDSNYADDKPINGRRFRKLQQKWEMLSGKDSDPSPPLSPTITPTKSKIPRPIISPVKPSGIPVLVSPTATGGGQSAKPPKKPPAVGGRTVPPPMKAPLTVCKNTPTKKAAATPKTVRTSRVDQSESGTGPRHIPRPSSLPYKAAPPTGTTSKMLPPRRAVSSSLNRKPLNRTNLPKVVRTLSHRVPSESGHLPYNEGENLKVVLEVDDKWLLCCRGSQKGLVPKSAVIADLGRY